jgi:hypothetical protein
MKLVKYPRTQHLPWSEGISSDDITSSDTNIFHGKNIVVTEKVDGENSTLTYTKVHARSIDSRDHPSRHWLKKLWSQILIPEGMRICGENMYAQHSIPYNQLPSYFLVFAIFEADNCLSWDEITEWCDCIGLCHVPVLYRGLWDIEKVKACYTGQSKYGTIQEGYVVRTASEFPIDQFNLNVAKFVRKNHVQTNEHWMSQTVIPNNLLKS